MKVPHLSRYHLLPFLLFLCTMWIRISPKALEAAGNSHGKILQATIPTTPVATDPAFCQSNWIFNRYPTAAATLGMAHDELWLALHDDQSIADFADIKQIDLQLVIDAIVTAETANIELLVQNDCLSPANANEKLTTLVSTVMAFVHDRTPPAFLICRVGWLAYDELTAVILNVDLMALHHALKAGETLITLATKQSISRQQLIDELVNAKLAIIEQLVETRCVAASDAALWNKLIPIEVTDFVDNSPKPETMKYWSEIFRDQQSALFLPLLMK